jgi:prepilin-type N-terminal cleavage/methylation domain-containing protein
MLRNRKAPSKNQFHSPEGFTLLELSIVILVVGVLLTPLLRLYQTYQIEELTRKTKEHITVATNGIGIFNPLRLPCPADRSLPPSDPAYGFEVCDLALIPNCTPFSNQGICQTNGSRDADGVGGIDKVVIGGVPLRWVDISGTHSSIFP